MEKIFSWAGRKFSLVREQIFYRVRADFLLGRGGRGVLRMLRNFVIGGMAKTHGKRGKDTWQSMAKTHGKDTWQRHMASVAKTQIMAKRDGVTGVTAESWGREVGVIALLLYNIYIIYNK
jgi:hypothetical protein